MMSSKSRTNYFLAGLLMVSLVWGCGTPEEEKTTDTGVIEVEVEQATLNRSYNELTFPGTIASDDPVTLSTKVMGEITMLSVEPGDRIRAGETVIRVDNENLLAQRRQVQAKLNEATASLANAEKDLERFTMLFEQESATQKELDDITTRYEAAKAGVNALQFRLDELENMLKYTELKAPFDGYVTKKMINKGDMASPGQPLLNLEKEQGLKAVLTVPEQDVDLFGVGDSVRIAVEAAGASSLPGLVKTVNRSAESTSRQFLVEIDAPALDEYDRIRSGMFANVLVRVPQEKQILIPAEALLLRGQLTGVFTVTENSELVLRWIQTGKKTDSRVEVLTGLSEGEQYVTAIDGRLREGQKVRIQ